MGNKISSGLFWSYSERILAQLVSIIVSLVLARIINPEEFGIISLVMIIINVCNVFVASGLGTGLIQKKNVDEIDFSTVFWLSLLLGVGLFCVVFLIAPVIEWYFKYENLVPVIRVMGLRLILASINSIQHAYVSRNMQFKKFFISTLFGTIVSGIVGICMALKGFGVWSIVAQYLTNTSIDTIVLWFVLDWHPKLIFKKERIGFFFVYGRRILGASLLDTLYTYLRSFIIGKRYSSGDLAFYNKGMQFPSLIVTNINTTISRVMFPALSKDQDEKDRIRNRVKLSVKASSYIISPLLIGLMIIAEPLVRLVLTDKWLPTVQYIYIFGLTYLFMPIHELNLQAIKATGHSEIVLKIEIIKKVFGVVTIVLAIVLWDSPLSIAASFLVYSLVALFINSFPGKKLYNYGSLEQIKDVFVSLIPSILMAIIIYPIKYVIDNNMLLLLLQITIGIIIYIALSYVTKNKVFFRLVSSIHIHRANNRGQV